MILPNDGDGVVTDGDGEPDGDGVPDGDGMVTDGTVFDGGAAGGVAPPWIDGGGVCPITATTSLGP